MRYVIWFLVGSLFGVAVTRLLLYAVQFHDDLMPPGMSFVMMLVSGCFGGTLLALLHIPSKPVPTITIEDAILRARWRADHQGGWQGKEQEQLVGWLTELKNRQEAENRVMERYRKEYGPGGELYDPKCWKDPHDPAQSNRG